MHLGVVLALHDTHTHTGQVLFFFRKRFAIFLPRVRVCQFVFSPAMLHTHMTLQALSGGIAGMGAQAINARKPMVSGTSSAFLLRES